MKMELEITNSNDPTQPVRFTGMVRLVCNNGGVAALAQGITITKLAQPEPCGDWHDKPLRWQVEGPGTELQKFCTKADAKLYATIRSRSASFNAASSTFGGKS